ncbi:MAG: nucleotidyl transferase AbiEii/AbiGii toxin family protein [Candidatus Zixiibacteriota bacterium]
MLSEKFRSIIQRGKSRDYYDVWILLKNYKKDFSNDELWGILKKNCQFKGIPKPTIEDFLKTEREEEARRFWERGLAHQLNDSPDFEKVLEELNDLIKGISK